MADTVRRIDQCVLHVPAIESMHGAKWRPVFGDNCFVSNQCVAHRLRLLVRHGNIVSRIHKDRRDGCHIRDQCDGRGGLLNMQPFLHKVSISVILDAVNEVLNIRVNPVRIVFP